MPEGAGNEFKEAVERLAEGANNESVGSIDYATNARAIALKAELEQDKIVEVLEEGYRLRSIVPLSGRGFSPNDFRLRFQFEKEQVVDLPDRDFVVIVDLPAKAVTRTVPFEHGAESEVPPLPFSLAVPSRAREVSPPLVELADRFAREWEFARRLSLTNTFEDLRAEGLNVPRGSRPSGPRFPTDPRFPSLPRFPRDPRFPRPQPLPVDPRFPGDPRGQLGQGDTAYNTPESTYYDTNLSSNYGTPTYSDGVTDDSTNDVEADYMTDSYTDYNTDYRIDTI